MDAQKRAYGAVGVDICVQLVPSHCQVSPRRADESLPPNKTARLCTESNAMAAYARAEGGPVEPAGVHAFPSNSHAPLSRPACALPPHTTGRPRPASEVRPGK